MIQVERDSLTPLQRSAVRIISEELVGSTAELFVSPVNELTLRCHPIGSPIVQPNELPHRNGRNAGAANCEGLDVAEDPPLLESPEIETNEASIVEILGNNTLTGSPIVPNESAGIEIETQWHEVQPDTTRPHLPFPTTPKTALPLPNPQAAHRTKSYTKAQMIAIYHHALAGIAPAKIRDTMRMSLESVYSCLKTLHPYLQAAKSLSGTERNRYVDEVSLLIRQKEEKSTIAITTKTDQMEPALKASNGSKRFPISDAILRRIADMLRVNPSLAPSECYTQLMKSPVADEIYSKAGTILDHWQEIKRRCSEVI